MDTIPSPVDSQERQMLYIRGHEALQEQLESARQKTLDQIEMSASGSHPDGIACSPSGDDLNVLSWLTRS